jgi:hypothetical protein
MSDGAARLRVGCGEGEVRNPIVGSETQSGNKGPKSHIFDLHRQVISKAVEVAASLNMQPELFLMRQDVLDECDDDDKRLEELKQHLVYLDKFDCFPKKQGTSSPPTTSRAHVPVFELRKQMITKAVEVAAILGMTPGDLIMSETDLEEKHHDCNSRMAALREYIQYLDGLATQYQAHFAEDEEPSSEEEEWFTADMFGHYAPGEWDALWKRKSETTSEGSKTTPAADAPAAAAVAEPAAGPA